MRQRKKEKTNANGGELFCVGVGMRLGAHLTPAARHAIKHADAVFLAVSDGVVEKWVESLNPKVISLQPFYQKAKPRNDTYREMVAAVLAAVHQGQQVCLALYGHPGVFACVGHRAIKAARSAGFPARMEPGVSAEDCLYADMGIDPGSSGAQHYEATQFLLNQRPFDPTAYLVLWQIGVVGDTTHTQRATTAAHRALLRQKLSAHYPADHLVYLYEAATLPLGVPRQEVMQLTQLPQAKVSQHSTLVIPPWGTPKEDPLMKQSLEKLAGQGHY